MKGKSILGASMGYFEVAGNVDEYLKLAEGYDGAEIIAELVDYLPPGARVLELGMGAGKDLKLLRNVGFEPVGSDVSPEAVEKYRKSGGEFPVMLLDARTMNTSERFDAVYSNKVLHALSKEELRSSLTAQARAIRPEGRLFHSFWHGDEVRESAGQRAQFYTPETLRTALPADIVLLHFGLYEEYEPDDSFWAVLSPA